MADHDFRISDCQMIPNYGMRLALIAIFGLLPFSSTAQNVHFAGLYVPEGLSCEDGARISEEYGDLGAGYVIYDEDGRRSDDGSCKYEQVQALRDTALQIVDLQCTYDGKPYTWRQVLGPMEGNRMLVINSTPDGTVLTQVLTYCGWVPRD